VALVVQKYGGSSVADADGIKRVAQRIVATRKAGDQVVVVVSAMGDSTDELMDLARQVSPLPPGRELDMLLTAGERISMALLAMAIATLGLEARSFTGSQAGVITDAAHGRARIIDIRPGRIADALADGAIPIVAGFQGVSQTTKDVTTLGRGARTPPRSRWPPRWPPTRARSTPTWTASSPPTRASCGPRGGSRGSATRKCSRWPPAGRRC
jgi:aspartate kinase